MNSQQVERLENIHKDLKDKDRHCVWRIKELEGEKKKIPYKPQSQMVPARSNHPEDFGSFERACKYAPWHYDGIGFLLGDGISGIDIDGCFDPNTPTADLEMPEVLLPFVGKSYIERSPSGTGVKVFLATNGVTFPCNEGVKEKDWRLGGNNREKGMEGYIGKRYFTETGEVMSTTENSLYDYKHENTQPFIDYMEDIRPDLFEKPKPKSGSLERLPVGNGNIYGTDEEVIQRIRNNAKAAPRFAELFDTYADGNPSQVDFQLIGFLIYWCNGDPDQMFRIVQASARYEHMDRKSNTDTYLMTSINNCIAKDGLDKLWIHDNPWYLENRPQVQKVVAQVVTEPVDERQVEEEVAQSTELPEIVINEQTEDGLQERKANEVADQAMRHFEAADPNEAKIFAKDRIFGFIQESNSSEGNLLIFNEFNVKSMTGALNRNMTFAKLSMDRKGNVSKRTLAAPQKVVVEDVVFNQDRGGLPALKMIANHPILNSEFDLINENGYHADDHIYIDGEKTIEIESMSVMEAWTIIMDWIEDFPFCDTSDKANAIALLLTPFIRTALPKGEVPPLFIVKANTQGSGKSTLAKILCAVTMGALPKPRNKASKEDEIAKHISAELIAGSEVIILDNIPEGTNVSSSMLASATSESSLAVRRLQYSEIVECENIATYIMTGNNIGADADLTDRSCWIRLESFKRASERNFKTDTILQDSLNNRAKLFSAMYTFVDVWKTDGMVFDEEINHRNRYWAKLIKGIFNSVKKRLTDEETMHMLDKFLENDIEARKESNPNFEAICMFRDEVLKEFGDTRWHSSDVIHIGSHRQGRSDMNILKDLMDNHHYHEADRAKEVTRVLKKVVDNVFGKYILRKDGTKQGRIAFRFEEVQDD